MPPAEARRTVLVVDDDREMSSIIQKVLTREHYDVRTAEDGEEALQAMRKRPADIVVADWKMPVLDGMRLIELVKREFPRAKVIMITAFGEVDEYLEAMTRGAYEFLPKPLDIGELKALVNRAAEEQAQRA